MSYRQVNWFIDSNAIRNAIHTLSLNSHRYSFIYKPNEDKAFNYVYASCLDGNAYIIDEAYLLLVSDVRPWCSDDIILQEELVLKLSSEACVLTNVVKALEDIASERGSDHIIISDSSIHLRLSKLYSRRGYTQITNQFYKEA
jgi:hypothetical protein